MRTLIPGEWYPLFVCEHCRLRQVLFPDLSKGTSKIVGSYVVDCEGCLRQACYESDVLERYQHPMDEHGRA